MSGRDVDYVYMVDTNDKLLPDHWELTPISQAMAFLIITFCKHVTSLTSSSGSQLKRGTLKQEVWGNQNIRSVTFLFKIFLSII